MPNNEVRQITENIRNSLICTKNNNILWRAGAPVPAEAVAAYYQRLQNAKQLFSSLSFPHREKVARILASTTIGPHLPKKLHDRIDAQALCDLVHTFQAGAEPISTLRQKLRELVASNEANEALAPLRKLLRYEELSQGAATFIANVEQKLDPACSFGQRMKNLRELRRAAEHPGFRSKCIRVISEGIRSSTVDVATIARIARLPKGPSVFYAPEVRGVIEQQFKRLFEDLRNFPPGNSRSSKNLHRIQQIEFLGVFAQFLDPLQALRLNDQKEQAAPLLRRLASAGIEQCLPLSQLRSLYSFANILEAPLAPEDYSHATCFVLHQLSLDPLSIFTHLRRSLVMFGSEVADRLSQDPLLQHAAARRLVELTDALRKQLEFVNQVSSIEEAEKHYGTIVGIQLAIAAVSIVFFRSTQSNFVRGDFPYLDDLFGEVSPHEDRLILYGTGLTTKPRIQELLPIDACAATSEMVDAALKERLDYSLSLSKSIYLPAGNFRPLSIELPMSSLLRRANIALNHALTIEDPNRIRWCRRLADIFLDPSASEYFFHYSPLTIAAAGLAFEHQQPMVPQNN